MIGPHGGRLVSCLASGQRQQPGREAVGLPKVPLNERELADWELIANGAMSPLEGFMTSAHYHRVVTSMRLASCLVWSLPVVFSLKTDQRPSASWERVPQTAAGAVVAVMEGLGLGIA